MQIVPGYIEEVEKALKDEIEALKQTNKQKHGEPETPWPTYTAEDLFFILERLSVGAEDKLRLVSEKSVKDAPLIFLYQFSGRNEETDLSEHRIDFTTEWKHIKLCFNELFKPFGKTLTWKGFTEKCITQYENDPPENVNSRGDPDPTVKKKIEDIFQELRKRKGFISMQGD
jgi:hypothetical protein